METDNLFETDLDKESLILYFKYYNDLKLKKLGNILIELDELFNSIVLCYEFDQRFPENLFSKPSDTTFDLYYKELISGIEMNYGDGFEFIVNKAHTGESITWELILKFINENFKGRQVDLFKGKAKYILLLMIAIYSINSYQNFRRANLENKKLEIEIEILQTQFESVKDSLEKRKGLNILRDKVKAEKVSSFVNNILLYPPELYFIELKNSENSSQTSEDTIKHPKASRLKNPFLNRVMNSMQEIHDSMNSCNIPYLQFEFKDDYYKDSY